MTHWMLKKGYLANNDQAAANGQEMAKLPRRFDFVLNQAVFAELGSLWLAPADASNGTGRHGDQSVVQEARSRAVTAVMAAVAEASAAVAAAAGEEAALEETLVPAAAAALRLQQSRQQQWYRPPWP